jgi:glycosyltransferase involved in cell wall biosynthesis
VSPGRSGDLRLAVDATPLLGQRTGVGRYLEGVLTGLAGLAEGPEPLLTVYSRRGPVPDPPPPRTRPAPRRLHGRLLSGLWSRTRFPPVEVLTGRIDVFHAGNYVLPPLWRAAGVVTLHDLTYLRYPDTVDDYVARYRVLVPDAVRRAARVVTVSEAVRQEVVAEFALDPATVVVAPNGVGREWAAARPLTPEQRARLGLPERYLLFVGNLEPRKGLPVLARAHAAARRSSPEVPVLALAGPAGWGDAWDGHEPDPDDVVRLGFLPDDDLRSTVAGAVAVCMPSRYEGFGLPVLEALACGRPALASDIPAHHEVAGDLAAYVPAMDVDAWAQALLGASRADEHAGLVRARRERAARFTWERSAARHLEVWRSAAGG